MADGRFTLRTRIPFRQRSILGAAAALVLAVAGLAWWHVRGGPAPPPKSGEAPVAAKQAHDDSSAETAADRAGQDEGQGLIRLDPQLVRTHIRTQPVVRRVLQGSVTVTGKIVLNEDRLAHVYPLVEGRVREVLVRFGDTVRKDQPLAVIQSREVGRAKLELVKGRVRLEFAQIDYEWMSETEQNTQALIQALKKNLPLEEIERRFRDRPIGMHRESLISAYAEYHKARADYERLKSLAAQGITAGKQLLAAEAALNASQARLVALLEQIGHTARHDRIRAREALHEAEVGLAVAEANLRILGYSADELQQITVDTADERLAYYVIRAPFDGTIIQKDVVLLERVAPDIEMFRIADLSTVWVTADIFEEHLPLLKGLQNRTIRLHSDAYPGEEFQATVFYTGDIVEPETRTVALRAQASNPDRRLKPGMFVTIDLPLQSETPRPVVPEAALQRHGETWFVFVQRDETTFERRDVQLGRSSGGWVEVRGGLHENERVVVRGGFALKSKLLEELLEDE